MNRRVILLGAGVVLVVAIVLAIKVSSSDSSTKPSSTPDRSAESPAKPETSTDRVKPAIDPATPKASGDQPTASPYVETEVNGVKIRDHRKNPGEPFQMPPTIRQHGPARLPGTLVGSVSNALQSAMKECTAALPADAKGTHPALEAELSVDIKDKQLTITSSTAQLLDVSGDTAAIKQCFEQKSVGKVLAAGSQEDGSQYAITLTYHL